MKNEAREALVRLAAGAFTADPFYSWLAPDGRARDRLLRALMRRALAGCAVRTIGQPVEGLVAYHAPDVRPRGGGWSLGIPRLLRRPVRAWRGLGLLVRLRKARPREPHLHIEVLAVSERARGQGHASALLTPLLERARQRAWVVHLETTNPDNLAFYGRFGFVETACITSPGVPRAWVMQRR